MTVAELKQELADVGGLTKFTNFTRLGMLGMRNRCKHAF